MNRAQRRLAEKQQNRAGNVRRDDVAVKAPVDYGALSRGVEALLDRATPDMQRELDLTLDPTCPPIKDLVLLVVDGTSRLAFVAPPEMKLRERGASGYVAKLVPRAALLGWLLENAAPVGEQLAAVACGHLPYLVSAGEAVMARCVTCDRGLAPSASAPS